MEGLLEDEFGKCGKGRNVSVPENALLVQLACYVRCTEETLVAYSTKTVNFET